MYLVNNGYTTGSGESLPAGIQLAVKEMNGQEEELDRWQQDQQQQQEEEEEEEGEGAMDA